MFYVYEWYIKETGEIIYVGKGCKNRYKVRKHNRLFNEMIKRYDCESRIVKRFDSEKEAFEYEFERVFQLKCIGQCVCNINKGGAGGVTNWWTDEKREQYSKNNVMKSKEQGAAMIHHEVTEGGLVRTEYDNGVSIYINKTDKSITEDGVTVDAMSYQVKGGKA